MIKSAITGNIASGKSTIEQMLKDRGFVVYDADKLSHEILYEKSDLIEEKFKGLDILDENNNISRKKLGDIVFKNNGYKLKLEEIIYPDLKLKINKIFKDKNNERYVFVSIPLLFEVGWQYMFDKILFVESEDNIRLARLMERNNLSKDDALLRINSQQKQKEKMQKSDFIIRNNDDIMLLQKQIDEFIILLEDME